MLNGSGIRVSLWVAGCEHRCNRCQNPQTWDIKSGILFDKNAENELFEALSKDWVAGITFTGGDPLHAENLSTVQMLVNKVKQTMPQKTIWLYTGYTLQECQKHSLRNEIINKCDYIIDGEYIDEKRDVTLKWRGSSNQRIWYNNNSVWVDVTDAI